MTVQESSGCAGDGIIETTSLLPVAAGKGVSQGACARAALCRSGISRGEKNETNLYFI